ncbi:ANTAR domain-containing protein [Arthrobacter sp. H5]|uniref:ANTAR domain-containing protein n=1 Tax=Arthrobacter sp. H5 TaxID=1267973 RepID=UPI0004B85ACA|nr:ANTAR domain-containing protein [Arthrobacter sp. H5]
MSDVFDDNAVSMAEGFARDASRSLCLAVRMAKLSDNNKQLKAAMEHRTTIDMAVGVIMGQNQCDQAEAISILGDASSARNIKLRDVAAAVLTSTGQKEPVTTHFES